MSSTVNFLMDNEIPKWIDDVPLLYRFRYIPVILNRADLFTNCVNNGGSITVQKKENNYCFVSNGVVLGVLLESNYFLDEWIRKNQIYQIGIDSIRTNATEIVEVLASIAFYGSELFLNIPINVKHRGKKGHPLNDFLLSSPILQVSLDNANVANKAFVFTGNLYSFPIEAASNLVAQRGGVVKQNVSKNVDYLVVGEPSQYTIERLDGKSKEHQKALAQQSQGHRIRIINETEFLQLLKL